MYLISSPWIFFSEHAGGNLNVAFLSIIFSPDRLLSGIVGTLTSL